MRLPLEFNAPLKLPLLNVSAVPSSVTTPEPNNVCTSTAGLNRFTSPSAVSVLATGNDEPVTLLNVAPEATDKSVLASAPDNASVPAVTLVAPVNVFTPVKVRIPLPSFVKEPAPRARTPFALVLPAPPKVTPKSTALTVPLRVNRPESELIRVAAASVTDPPKTFTSLILLNAPPLANPVPLNVSASAPTVIFPCSCSAAPSATNVAPSVVPSASLL